MKKLFIYSKIGMNPRTRRRHPNKNSDGAGTKGWVGGYRLLNKVHEGDIIAILGDIPNREVKRLIEARVSKITSLAHLEGFEADGIKIDYEEINGEITGKGWMELTGNQRGYAFIEE